MERDDPITITVDMGENFNSHAHVERDVHLWGVDSGTGISTHTLTWSVTHTILNKLQNMKISTHTLTWSVTRP